MHWFKKTLTFVVLTIIATGFWLPRIRKSRILTFIGGSSSVDNFVLFCICFAFIFGIGFIIIASIAIIVDDRVVVVIFRIDQYPSSWIPNLGISRLMALTRLMRLKTVLTSVHDLWYDLKLSKEAVIVPKAQGCCQKSGHFMSYDYAEVNILWVEDSELIAEVMCPSNVIISIYGEEKKLLKRILK